MIRNPAVLARAALALLAATLATAAPARATDYDLAITGVTLVSPERAAPLADANVYIRGDRIARIEANARPRPAARTIDGRGRYLTPGLIDSHVHLYNVSGLRGEGERIDALRDAYFRQLPRSYLYFGFTTLIELNAISAATNARFRSAPHAPDLYDCSDSLVLSNGFGISEYPPETALTIRDNFLYDHYRGDPLPDRFDRREHTPAATVERIRARGGICVKTYYEDGFGGTVEVDWRMPTPEIMRDVAREARARRLPLVMHANSLAAQRFALDTGADIIAHGLWHWGPGSSAETLPPEIRAVLDRIAARRTGIQPSMRVLSAASAMFDPAFLDDRQLAHVLPAALLGWLRSDEGQAQRELFRTRFADGRSDAEVREAMGEYERKVALTVGYLARSGARLLLGTDTAVGMGWGNPPGYNGLLEMRSWLAAGVSPRAIFRAATIDNARAFGLEREIGSVARGKRANLLLMRANPAETIEAYDMIDLVILRGEPLDRNRLSATRQEGEAP